MNFLTILAKIPFTFWLFLFFFFIFLVIYIITRPKHHFEGVISPPQEISQEVLPERRFRDNIILGIIIGLAILVIGFSLKLGLDYIKKQGVFYPEEWLRPERFPPIPKEEIFPPFK